MKSSPKPARMAPAERVLPLAISQRGGNPQAKTKDRDQPWRRSRTESRADDDPDRLREGDQSGADETDDGQRRRGRGLNGYREERTRYNCTQSPANECLQRTSQRVARKTFETFSKMVDSEQKQSQSTDKRNSGGGGHRRPGDALDIR